MVEFSPGDGGDDGGSLEPSESGDAYERYVDDGSWSDEPPAVVTDDAGVEPSTTSPDASAVGNAAVASEVEVVPVDESADDTRTERADGPSPAERTDAPPPMAAERAEYHHLQGDNDAGFEGTCGLASTEGVLRDLGHEVSENDVVEVARTNGLCDTASPDARRLGGTSPDGRRAILARFGEASDIRSNTDISVLADDVDAGRGVIASVNAGYLWLKGEYLQGGRANHAVVVTAVERDADTGQPTSFWINDSGKPDGAAVEVPADRMALAFEVAGGTSNVTERSRGGESHT